MTENEYVTRAELTAHLDPMKEDIAEIKSDVKSVLLVQAGTRAVEMKMKDHGARKIAYGSIFLYLISAATAVLALALAHA